MKRLTVLLLMAVLVLGYFALDLDRFLTPGRAQGRSGDLRRLVAVPGGGPIGADLAQAIARLGPQVTQVET